MKGATIEPCASINNPPSINIIMMVGVRHNILRTRKNVHSSFETSNLFSFTINGV